MLAGVALAGRRAAGVGVGAALLGWRRLLGLRGARCWAWAAGGAGVAHSRLRRVAARAGLGRRGVCAACLAGVVRGAVAGRALRGGRVQSVSRRTRQGVGVGEGGVMFWGSVCIRRLTVLSAGCACSLPFARPALYMQTTGPR